MSDVQDPELEDVADLIAHTVMSRIRGFEIGRVTRWDSGTQSVSVQPLVARARIGEDGARAAVVSAEVSECPVWFPGAGATRVTVAPSVGDYGLILYSSVSLARWKRRGGVVDPADDRLHDQSDAVFVPGGHPLFSHPTTVPSDAMVLHAGSLLVKIGGPTGTQKTLMADSFLSALDALHDALVGAITGLPGGSGVAVALSTAIAQFKVTARAGYKTDKTEVK